MTFRQIKRISRTNPHSKYNSNNNHILQPVPYGRKDRYEKTKRIPLLFRNIPYLRIFGQCKNIISMLQLLSDSFKPTRFVSGGKNSMNFSLKLLRKYLTITDKIQLTNAVFLPFYYVGF